MQSSGAQNPRASLAIFFASTLAVLIATALVGHWLPDPYGSFVPMLDGHDVVRDEFVREHAIAETPTPCVALIGDSRTAFNISAAIIDQALPPNCKSQNYGFPALRIPKLAQIVSELDAHETIVVSLSESILLAPRGEWWELASDQYVDRILRVPWLRYLYLGFNRSRFAFSVLHGTPLPNTTGWIWSSSEKRWQYRGLEHRDLVQLPSYEQEAADMAGSYFVKNRITGAGLDDFLKSLAAQSRHLIVVIPPSEQRFQALSEKLQPDEQRKAWRLIDEATRKAGATLIDCSTHCVDQSGFADPVHLNDEGVVAYSRALALRLCLLVAQSR